MDTTGARNAATHRPPMTPDSIARRYSAVVVNYNGEATLTGCIQSLLQEGLPAEQIFVVDNGSRDQSIPQLERAVPGVAILRNPCNAGFARAVNRGLAQAAGDFILLLNNDAQLQPGALRAFDEAFHRFPRLAIAGGQLQYPDGRLQTAVAPSPSLAAEFLSSALLRLLFPRRFRGKVLAHDPQPVDCVLGACIAARLDAVRQFGPLDEDYFFYFEEIDWCERARRAGLEVRHVPAACAFHLHGQTANRYRAGARIEYQRSQLTFYAKNRGAAASAVLSLLLPIKTAINAVMNTAGCVATGFLVEALREKTRVYWQLTAWHLLGRPTHWGLPEKCERSGAQPEDACEMGPR